MSEADLARVQGYRVDTHDGRIGTVAAVLPRAGGPSRFLLMQSGLMSCRFATVPFSDVETVDPGRRRLLLRDVPGTTREAVPNDARDRISACA